VAAGPLCIAQSAQQIAKPLGGTPEQEKCMFPVTKCLKKAGV